MTGTTFGISKCVVFQHQALQFASFEFSFRDVHVYTCNKCSQFIALTFLECCHYPHQMNVYQKLMAHHTLHNFPLHMRKNT